MLALSFFWAVAMVPALLLRPLVREALGQTPGASQGQRRAESYALTLVSLGLGTAVFLVGFALFAMVLGSYGVSFALTLGALALAFVWGAKRRRAQNKTEVAESPLSPGEGGLLGIAAVATVVLVHVGFFWPRRYFSDIQFNPGALGGEKLFNMHFLSSFLRGTGFPPEDVWLAHEAVTYYVLPKALPGVVASLWQTFSGGENIAATLFHVGDTWFMALGFGLALAAGLLVPGRLFPGLPTQARVLCAASVALLPWLSAPARGLVQLREGRFELWPLSRIVPGTVNEYPFWNWVWADNHAHSAVMFMQVSHIVLFSVVATERTRARPALFILLGILSAAILQSHGMSVPILVAFYGALSLHVVSRMDFRHLRVPFWNLLGAVAVCAVLTVPFLTRMPKASLKFYLVPPDIASTLKDFSNVHFTPFVVIGLVVVLCLAGLSRAGKRSAVSKRNLTGILSYGLTGAVVAALGYFSAGVVFLVLGSLLWMIEKEDIPEQQKVVRGGFVAGAAALYVVPEFFAMNWDMGREYMRYNTVFRFQFESFHLVPIALAAALAPSQWWGSVSKPLRALAWCCVAALACVLLLVQKNTVELRMHERAKSPTLDGARYIAEQNPVDAKLIDVLSRMEGRVVLAEECGVNPKAAAYGEFGRLSAFSGQVALCGWGGHSYLFHNVMTAKGPDKGRSTWEVLLEREKAVKEVYAAARNGTRMADTTSALLQKWKVTHFAFGPLEEKHNEGVTIESLSKTVGPVVWREGSYGLVALEERL